MKRVVSLQYASAKLLGVTFKQERRGGVFVGVAVVSPEAAKPFEDRDDFEVEDLDPAEADQFPDDFPLLGKQRAALAKAGLTDLDKLRAHDFAAQKVSDIGPASEATIAAYLNRPPPNKE